MGILAFLKSFFLTRNSKMANRFLARIGGFFHSRVLKLGGIVYGHVLKSPRGVGHLDSKITHLSLYPNSTVKYSTSTVQ